MSSAQDPGGGCTDATGATIPCPPSTGGSSGSQPSTDTGSSDSQSSTGASSSGSSQSPAAVGDRDGDGLSDDRDACPDQIGDSSGNGCPIVEEPASVEVPVNPVRPAPDGACQLTSYAQREVNVRAEPSLEAAVVTTLDPNQLYTVIGAVVVDGVVWYRVEGGWVSANVVTVGGLCPVRQLSSKPDSILLPSGVYDPVAGGIFPEEKCETLYNGAVFCQIELSAVAEEGEAEGQIGGEVVQCGGIPPNNFCVVVDFSIEVPDQPEEFFEPEPESTPPPPPPSNDEGEGQAVSCEELLNTLAAQTEGSTYLEYTPDGIGKGFDLAALPALPPDPCRISVGIFQVDEANNGMIPVDTLTLETTLPDTGLLLPAIQKARQSAARVNLFNRLLISVAGDVCINFTHGDFSFCPPAFGAMDELVAPNPSLPPNQLLDLASGDSVGDPTAYECWGSNINGKPMIVCACKAGNSEDCLDLAANACFDGLACNADVCACGFPDTPD